MLFSIHNQCCQKVNEHPRLFSKVSSSSNHKLRIKESITVHFCITGSQILISGTTEFTLKDGGPEAAACNIQIHIKVSRCPEMPPDCVCMHVYLCEIMATLWFPGVIFFKLSGALFPSWPPLKSFDEDPEEKALIACTYCVNSGNVLETSPPSSHHLLFQSCRRSFICLCYLLP